MKLNPIYLKELKMSARSNRLYMILFIYNGLLALFTLFTFLIVFRSDIRGGVVEYGIILKIYGIIAAIEFGLLLFIMPSITASTISGERERQTLELLLATKLRPTQIIIGKLTSAISFMTLLAVSSLPILSLVFIIGGISLVQMAEFLLLIIVTGIYIGSIGIFFSTLYKKTTISTVASYCTVLVLIFGTILIVWMISSIGNYNGTNVILDITKNDVGKLLYILLMNPAVTFLSMIGKQIGDGTILNELLEKFGTISFGAVERWFQYSVLSQLIISIVLLTVSSVLLTPRRQNELKYIMSYKKLKKNKSK